MLAIAQNNTLTKVELTLLEGYSFTVIEAIGKYCRNIHTFHLHVWNGQVEDMDNIDILQDHFPALEDLKIKCEDPIEMWPEIVFFYFFCCQGIMHLYIKHITGL